MAMCSNGERAWAWPWRSARKERKLVGMLPALTREKGEGGTTTTTGKVCCGLVVVEGRRRFGCAAGVVIVTVVLAMAGQEMRCGGAM